MGASAVGRKACRGVDGVGSAALGGGHRRDAPLGAAEAARVGGEGGDVGPPAADGLGGAEGRGSHQSLLEDGVPLDRERCPSAPVGGPGGTGGGFGSRRRVGSPPGATERSEACLTWRGRPGFIARLPPAGVLTCGRSTRRDVEGLADRHASLAHAIGSLTRRRPPCTCPAGGALCSRCQRRPGGGEVQGGRTCRATGRDRPAVEGSGDRVDLVGATSDAGDCRGCTGGRRWHLRLG